MASKRITLSDQVRQAVDASGLSRYAIARAIGVDDATMSRFMSGERGLRMSALDDLADFLNLHIVAGEGPKQRNTGRLSDSARAAGGSGRGKARKGR